MALNDRAYDRAREEGWKFEPPPNAPAAAFCRPGTFQWPAGSEIPAKSDQVVLAATPELIGRSLEVAQLLAEYLGGIRSNNARDLLWQVAERPEPAHEQALIALTWIGDQQDLPRLAELLV